MTTARVACRVGSTGHNYGSREFEGHMHNGLWRVDVNLGGPGQQHASGHGAHRAGRRGQEQGEDGPSSRSTSGKEGFEDFDAHKFTMLSIVNTKMKNARKQPCAYDVVVPRMGMARHHGGGNEDCTLHDFWVTRKLARRDELRQCAEVHWPGGRHRRHRRRRLAEHSRPSRCHARRTAKWSRATWRARRPSCGPALTSGRATSGTAARFIHDPQAPG